MSTDPVKMNETTVLKRISITDEATFCTVVQTYSEKLFSLAFNITRNRQVSEDILQDCFMKLWQKRTEIIFDNVGHWLCRVVFNMACTYLRRETAKSKIINALLHHVQDGYAPGGEEYMIQKERVAIFSKVYSSLPPQQKIVYELSRVNDLSRCEIATRLKISPHTVRNHLSKASQFLKENAGAASLVLLLLALQILFSGESSTNGRFNSLYNKSERSVYGKEITHKTPGITRHVLSVP